jgi:predicted membrane protein
MEEDQNEIPMNNQGGIDGCSIAAFGLFTFFVGLGLLILGMYLENGLLLIIGLFLGTLVTGFLILYPIVRLLFGGKDSVAAAITTAYVEGVITRKIIKNARKKRTRY